MNKPITIDETNIQAALSEGALKLFTAHWNDSGNWNWKEYALYTGTAEDRGWLTELKRKGLVQIMRDNGDLFMEFRALGVKLGEELDREAEMAAAAERAQADELAGTLPSSPTEEPSDEPIERNDDELDGIGNQIEDETSDGHEDGLQAEREAIEASALAGLVEYSAIVAANTPKSLEPSTIIPTAALEIARDGWTQSAEARDAQPDPVTVAVAAMWRQIYSETRDAFWMAEELEAATIAKRDELDATRPTIAGAGLNQWQLKAYDTMNELSAIRFARRQSFPLGQSVEVWPVYGGIVKRATSHYMSAILEGINASKGEWQIVPDQTGRYTA